MAAAAANEFLVAHAGHAVNLEAEACADWKRKRSGCNTEFFLIKHTTLKRYLAVDTGNSGQNDRFNRDTGNHDRIGGQCCRRHAKTADEGCRHEEELAIGHK